MVSLYGWRARIYNKVWGCSEWGMRAVMGDENIALSDRATRPGAPTFLRSGPGIHALLFMAHGPLLGPVSSRILKEPL